MVAFNDDNFEKNPKPRMVIPDEIKERLSPEELSMVKEYLEKLASDANAEIVISGPNDENEYTEKLRNLVQKLKNNQSFGFVFAIQHVKAIAGAIDELIVDYRKKNKVDDVYALSSFIMLGTPSNDEVTYGMAIVDRKICNEKLIEKLYMLPPHWLTDQDSMAKIALPRGFDSHIIGKIKNVAEINPPRDWRSNAKHNGYEDQDITMSFFREVLLYILGIKKLDKKILAKFLIGNYDMCRTHKNLDLVYEPAYESFSTFIGLANILSNFEHSKDNFMHLMAHCHYAAQTFIDDKEIFEKLIIDYVKGKIDLPIPLEPKHNAVSEVVQAVEIFKKDFKCDDKDLEDMNLKTPSQNNSSNDDDTENSNPEKPG